MRYDWKNCVGFTKYPMSDTDCAGGASEQKLPLTHRELRNVLFCRSV